jgi:hypothetical protein
VAAAATHSLERVNGSPRDRLDLTECGLPVLTTVEDAEDGDHELVGRLVDHVDDEGLLLEGARPHTWRTSSHARPASGKIRMPSMWLRIADTNRRAVSDDAALVIQSWSSLSC